MLICKSENKKQAIITSCASEIILVSFLALTRWMIFATIIKTIRLEDGAKIFSHHKNDCDLMPDDHMVLELLANKLMM